jgi:hypothetical protein
MDVRNKKKSFVAMWSTLQVIKKKDVRNENKKRQLIIIFFSGILIKKFIHWVCLEGTRTTE